MTLYAHMKISFQTLRNSFAVRWLGFPNSFYNRVDAILENVRTNEIGYDILHL